MSIYRLQLGDEQRREAVATWLAGLELVSSAVREQIITAWVTTWMSSPFESLDDMPFSALAPSYPLTRHVNDVTLTGLDLARRASAQWGDDLDLDVLVPILALHDVDKPLMFRREGDKVTYVPLAREIPHGVVGAMLVKELDFPDRVVSAVATHAGNAPFHGRTLEDYLLHYADFFSADHVVMAEGGHPPFYQRHGR
jgi:putative nucleotidyltransferase with HDIG domain